MIGYWFVGRLLFCSFYFSGARHCHVEGVGGGGAKGRLAESNWTVADSPFLEFPYFLSSSN